jgi:nanoRNase/pAp phosphatase (c-di-AMP/oligoRNAs hydrolase)
MNNAQNTVARISEIFNKGASGVIVIPPNPTIDAQAAAASLFLGLTKMNKNVSLVCSTKPESDLIAIDKIKTQFATGGDSLMVSFPYSDGAIDKVDYNIQGEAFNLIITPRSGFPKLDPKAVNFSYTGGMVDFIITIDSPTLNSLGQIYTDNQNHFTGRDIVNIDRHLTNAFFGTVNFVNKTVSSVSELILNILQELKIEIDRDMATNLYSGIAAATNNFTSYSVSADTFENIAALLRSGAVKKLVKKPEPVKTNYAPTPESQPTPIEEVEKEKSAQDWLKPKIFKNSGLI